MAEINGKAFELHWDDLSREAKERYLKFKDVDSKEELKLDEYPIFVEEKRSKKPLT